MNASRFSLDFSRYNLWKASNASDHQDREQNLERQLDV